MDFDQPLIRQSERLETYAEAVARLETYPCYCTRREIAEAASAPHGDGYRPYPGTCLHLTAARRAELSRSRPPALRVRAAGAESTIEDLWAGQVRGEVDDFVVVRNDGVPAYNLAVVVDDIAMGVDQICRGDDLLSSAPRQAWLTGQLGGTQASYAHLPLVVNRSGARLSKRDGATSLADLAGLGVSADQLRVELALSLGIEPQLAALQPGELVPHFDPAKVPTQPWVAPALGSAQEAVPAVAKSRSIT